MFPSQRILWTQKVYVNSSFGLKRSFSAIFCILPHHSTHKKNHFVHCIHSNPYINKSPGYLNFIQSSSGMNVNQQQKNVHRIDANGTDSLRSKRFFGLSMFLRNIKKAQEKYIYICKTTLFSLNCDFKKTTLVVLCMCVFFCCSFEKLCLKNVPIWADAFWMAHLPRTHTHSAMKKKIHEKDEIHV